jgi:hypothetical protein
MTPSCSRSSSCRHRQTDPLTHYDLFSGLEIYVLGTTHYRCDGE